MSSKEKLNNHLVSNIDNTDENVKFVKDINKKAKASNSIWRLGIRYRKPKEGFTYGYGGSLRKENANAFSIYINDVRPWDERPETQFNSRMSKENDSLKSRIIELENKLRLAENPYKDWSIVEIENLKFELRDSIVHNYIYQIYDENLINQYNFITEAQEIYKRYKEEGNG